MQGSINLSDISEAIKNKDNIILKILQTKKTFLLSCTWREDEP